jgi:hypothetical protein
VDTPPNNTEPEPQPRRYSRFHRCVLSPLNILFVIVPVLCLADDLVVRPAESARTKVEHQLRQIRSVDANSLLSYFGKDLYSHTCNWRLQCTLNPQENSSGPDAPVALNISLSALSQDDRARFQAGLPPRAHDAAATAHQPISAPRAPLSLADVERDLAFQRRAAAPPVRNTTPEVSPSFGTSTTPDDGQRAVDLPRLAFWLKAKNAQHSQGPVGTPMSPVERQGTLAIQRLESTKQP